MINLRGISPATTFGVLQKSLSDTDWNFKQIVLKFTDPMKFNPPIILDRQVVDFSRSIILQTQGKTRWQTGLNGSLESGANAGGDYILQAVADDGVTPLGQVFFERATGNFFNPGSITATNAGFLSPSNSPAVLLSSTPATGNHKFIEFTNAGCDMLVGIESASGGSLYSGSSIYAMVVGTTSARNIEFFTSNGKRMTIGAGGGITMHAGSLLVETTSGTAIQLNTTTGAVGDFAYVGLQRGGTLKWRVGYNISSSNNDQFEIWNETIGVALGIEKTTSNVTLNGGSVKITGVMAFGNVPNLLRLQRVNSVTFNIVADSNGFADLQLGNLVVNNTIVGASSGNGDINLQPGTAAGVTVFRSNGGSLVGFVNVSGGMSLNGGFGVNGVGVVAKPTVTGSRGGNAALASLLTALASYGLITDSSTP